MGMEITHQVLPTGHFIVVKTAQRELSVCTTRGTWEELQAEADSVALHAERMMQRALLMRAAAETMREREN